MDGSKMKTSHANLLHQLLLVLHFHCMPLPPLHTRRVMVHVCTIVRSREGFLQLADTLDGACIPNQGLCLAAQVDYDPLVRTVFFYSSFLALTKKRDAVCPYPRAGRAVRPTLPFPAVHSALARIPTATLTGDSSSASHPRRRIEPSHWRTPGQGGTLGNPQGRIHALRQAVCPTATCSFLNRPSGYPYSPPARRKPSNRPRAIASNMLELQREVRATSSRLHHWPYPWL
jgi:hypothetical protein